MLQETRANLDTGTVSAFTTEGGDDIEGRLKDVMRLVMTEEALHHGTTQDNAMWGRYISQCPESTQP